MLRTSWSEAMAQVSGTDDHSDEQALAILLSTHQGDAPLARQLSDGAQLSVWRTDGYWVLALRRAPSLPRHRHTPRPMAATPDTLFRTALRHRWQRAGALDAVHVALGGDGAVHALCRVSFAAARDMATQLTSDHDALNALLTPMRKLLDEN